MLDPQPEPENGQTGSPGLTQCSPSDNVGDFNPACAVHTSEWSEPFGRAELVRGVCGHSRSSSALPVCECTLRITPRRLDEATGGPLEPYEFVSGPGGRPDGCSEYGRTPACLYCEGDFPGCTIDDAASCDTVCRDLAERYDAELQKTFSVTSRIARCKDDFYCAWVTQIDGQCYAREPNSPEMPALDCSLSDEQILQHAGEYGGSCSARPRPTCSTASDCPRGLACGDGRCIPCSGGCNDAQGNPVECAADPRCADGEACIEGSCIPEANVTCRSFIDCPKDQLCALSGLELSGGRGNDDTRSFCLAPSTGDANGVNH